MTTDVLDRLPPEVRQQAQRDVRTALADGSMAAFEAGDDVTHGACVARDAVLAEYAAAADQADAAGQAAKDNAWAHGDPHPGLGARAADHARAEFWQTWLLGRKQAKREPSEDDTVVRPAADSERLRAALKPDGVQAALDDMREAAEAWTLTAEFGPPRWTIPSDDGLRMVLDAVERYVAKRPNPGEIMTTVAALVRVLPHGMNPTVRLAHDHRAAFKLLASMKGAEVMVIDTAISPGGGTVVAVDVDGVEFLAGVRGTP